MTKTKWSKFIQFPLTRIFIAILFLAPIIATRNIFSFVVLDRLENPWASIVQYFEILISITALFMMYTLYTKKIENRPAFELGLKKWFEEFGSGTLVGGGLVIIIVSTLILLNSYSIYCFNSPSILLERIFRYGIGSFIEEVIFTLIIFRLTEEFAGTIISVVTVSLLFGFMHFGNDNASIFSSTSIALEHIIILAPFILTRRIWMVWAIHFSWNYFQTAVFGMNNSGMEHKGFIEPVIEGPDWLTGGSFGIEASYISIALNIILGTAILLYAKKIGQMVKPSWKRNFSN